MDGEALARSIKSDHRLDDTVIIMLSSSGRRPDPAKMEDAGIAAYLNKPARFSQVLDTFRKVCAAAQGNNVSLLRLGRMQKETPRAPAKPERSQPAKQCRLLVVEDNRVNQKVAVHLLERLGCVVELASNGEEGVRLSGSRKYDMLLMDCQMPVMDGFAATAEIRRRERSLGHTIIIAMTANAMPEDRERCLKAGMDDYISKPINRSELIRVLEQFVPSWDQAVPVTGASSDEKSS